MSEQPTPIWTEDELRRALNHFSTMTDSTMIAIIYSHIALLRKEKDNDS